MRNAFEFNPFWPTRTDPVFVVRTLEQSAGTNLDTNQRFAICAVLDGLPVGASMRDFVVAMKARDAVALGVTTEQYTALAPIFETMQTWQESGAYGHLFNQDADVMTDADNLPNVTELVEDLLGVIKYLTEDGGAPPFNGRFVSVRDDKDVSAEVNPVIARAEAYLLACADSAQE